MQTERSAWDVASAIYICLSTGSVWPNTELIEAFYSFGDKQQHRKTEAELKRDKDSI